jgi:hypothetical protein
MPLTGLKMPYDTIPYIYCESAMRNPKTIFLAGFTVASLISGCGVETASTAATVGKLQADQAKQAQQNMEKFKTGLDSATKLTDENLRKTEEAGRN